VALAAITFAAGAVAGNVLAPKNLPSPPGITFEAQIRALPTAPTRTLGKTAAPRTSTATAPALRPPVVSRKSKSRRSSASHTPRRAGRTQVSWASNVLGVTARVVGKRVTVVWSRPANSDHVVVVRTRASRHHGVVVFRGRATSYRDRFARRCTAYRYTIVNYDRRGHRSTGVPTAVVTGGCSR
jgi:hypothetical protein